MCKYCEFTSIDKLEQVASTKITEIREGKTVLCVTLYRYHTTDGSYRQNELILDHCIDVESYGGLIDVETSHVNIKYCPFCGEEL